MATQQQIQDAILLGRSYRFELVDDLLTNLKKGCCGNTSLIAQISGLISSLEHRIDDNIYNLTTNSLYSCLLTSIANYSGASLSVDPNASLPNTIIEGGGIIIDSRPDPIDVFYADMSGDNGSGGRTTYTNADWIGWYPYLQTRGVVQLYEGKDYSYNVSTGTFILLPDALSGITGIYEGGSIRAVNYSRTSDVPDAPFVSYISLNNVSTQSIVYNDNGSGDVTLVAGDDFYKTPVISGQSFVTTYPVGTTLNFGVYDVNGLVFSESFPNPPSLANTLNSMSTDRYYVVDVIDTETTDVLITWF